MRPVPRFAAAALAVASFALLAGCGSSDDAGESIGSKIGDKIIEKSSGGKIDVDSSKDGSVKFKSKDGSYEIDSDGKGSVKIDSKDGTYQAGENVSVPGDFPSAVPVPKGATLTSAISTNEGWSLGYAVSDWKAAAAAYATAVEAAGFTQDTAFDSTDMSSHGYSAPDFTVAYVAGSDGTQGYLNVIVGKASTSGMS